MIAVSLTTFSAQAAAPRCSALLLAPSTTLSKLQLDKLVHGLSHIKTSAEQLESLSDILVDLKLYHGNSVLEQFKTSLLLFAEQNPGIVQFETLEQIIDPVYLDLHPEIADQYLQYLLSFGDVFNNSFDEISAPHREVMIKVASRSNYFLRKRVQKELQAENKTQEKMTELLSSEDLDTALATLHVLKAQAEEYPFAPVAIGIAILEHLETQPQIPNLQKLALIESMINTLIFIAPNSLETYSALERAQKQIELIKKNRVAWLGNKSRFTSPWASQYLRDIHARITKTLEKMVVLTPVNEEPRSNTMSAQDIENLDFGF